MNSELNLLTTEEKFEQKTSLAFKILNILFIVLFLIVSSLSVYSYIQLSKLLEIEQNYKNKKQELLQKVSAYSEEEVFMRDIVYRYQQYSSFQNQIEDVAEIVKEIYFRANGTSVEIMTINFEYDVKQVSIRVRSSSEQFTRFVNNLKNTNFKGEGSLYPTLFYPSPRNEEVDQAIQEYIVYIKYRPEVLRP